MQDSDKKTNPLIPLVVIALIVALMIWLTQGSSNQAHLNGWQTEWQETTPFQLARRAPAAATADGFIYVVGGIDGDEHYVTTVEYAPILKNGSLGSWRQTTDLNEGRFYNGAIAYNGYLYAIGGGAGELGHQNYPVASVERAKINADGSLGPWQLENHLATARRGLQVVRHDNTLYAVGGYNGLFLKSVERATIRPDGSLSPWQLEQHESIIDRYIHSAAIRGDVIYLLGGHMQSPNSASHGDIETSRINDDGSLQPWHIEATSLITPRLVAEAFVLGNHLYIAGGHSGGARLVSVETGRLNADGGISQWHDTTPLPLPHSAAAVATDKNRVYLLGGGGDGGPLNHVHMATANRQGELGHWQSGH